MFAEGEEILSAVVGDDHRVVTAVGRGEGKIARLGAEQAEQTLPASDRGGRPFGEHLRPLPPRRPLGDPVTPPLPGIDRGERRGGDVLVPRFVVDPLLLRVVGGVAAEPTADDNVEARQWFPAVRHRAHSHHVAGDVLVVVAADVVGIGAGRRGMGDRHARHGADGPALLLERARDRLDLFPCGIDVDRVVVGLAAGAESGGRGG